MQKEKKKYMKIRNILGTVIALSIALFPQSVLAEVLSPKQTVQETLDDIVAVVAKIFVVIRVLLSLRHG